MSHIRRGCKLFGTWGWKNHVIAAQDGVIAGLVRENDVQREKIAGLESSLSHHVDLLAEKTKESR